MVPIYSKLMYDRHGRGSPMATTEVPLKAVHVPKTKHPNWLPVLSSSRKIERNWLTTGSALQLFSAFYYTNNNNNSNDVTCFNNELLYFIVWFSILKCQCLIITKTRVRCCVNIASIKKCALAVSAWIFFKKNFLMINVAFSPKGCGGGIPSEVVIYTPSEKYNAPVWN